ncbi:hypothetical protein HZP45_16815 [Elizabethkingia anophelis]|nr:hypothetical protein [Elizabethkingia anophelis]
MNEYLFNFKTLRKELRVIFCIAIFLIITIEFIFNSLPEIFPKAYIVSQIILKLSYSYISALFFYYLIVHFNRQKQKKNIYKAINNIILKILSEKKFLYEIIKSQSDNVDFSPIVKGELEVKLQLINSSNHIPVNIPPNIGQMKWYKYLCHFSNKTIYHIELIIKQSSFLDPEMLIILNEIYNNNLFVTTHSLFMYNNIMDVNLDVYTDDFLSYFEKIQKLDNYYEIEIKKYI